MTLKTNSKMLRKEVELNESVFPELVRRIFRDLITLGHSNTKYIMD